MFRPVYSAEALRFLVSLRSRRIREGLLEFAVQLAADPYRSGQSHFIGADGRNYQLHVFRQFIVTTWLDDPVKELRIVLIESA